VALTTVSQLASDDKPSHEQASLGPNSWLNAVEGFFANLTKRRLKRACFVRSSNFRAAINRFLAETNSDPRHFRWTKDPYKILAAVKRGHQVLDSIH
jgi:hypothetical protein